MRVISVRVFPTEYRLEAYVRHEDKLMMVPLFWRARVPTSVPPKEWYDTVLREAAESLSRPGNKSINDIFTRRRS